MSPENTITTYETPASAWRVLQYGFEPVIAAYRVKDYKFHKVENISTNSLRRLEKLTKKAYKGLSDTGPSWFRTVYYVRPVNVPIPAIVGLISAYRIHLNTQTGETWSGNVLITGQNRPYVDMLKAQNLVYEHDNEKFSLTNFGVQYVQYLIDNDPQIAKFYYRS